MEELQRKYARFLVKYCLRLKDKDKLFIIGSKEIMDFINILIAEVSDMNLDIRMCISDYQKQKELLLNYDYEYLIHDDNFDKTVYNEMANKGYAFLNLFSPMPDYFKEVDKELLSNINKYQQSSISEYRNMQANGTLIWNISAVANSYWAKSLDISEEELWNKIFLVCGIDKQSDPVVTWNNKLATLTRRKNYLNNLDILYLHYTNSLGTDLYIYLPDDYLFCAADEGNLVNLPTEEVFSSPDYTLTKGIVYASKPLIYNGVVIDKFYLKFCNGKVVDFKAAVGKETLSGILNTDEGSKYLGEVALVDNTSIIAKMNFLFKNTLLDENASCHLALGEGFMECRKDGVNVPIKNNDKKVNESLNHVDFFIGTDDLNIEAVTKDNKHVMIMENGLFKGEMR